MSAAWYADTREAFLAMTSNGIRDQLAAHAAIAGLDVPPDQSDEWLRSTSILQENLGNQVQIIRNALQSESGHAIHHVILEYDFRRRALRCLVVVDLKLGKFSHADAGQMNLYLNYAREHLKGPDEHEPVGLIHCSAKNDAVVHYAMGDLRRRKSAGPYRAGRGCGPTAIFLRAVGRSSPPARHLLPCAST